MRKQRTNYINNKNKNILHYESSGEKCDYMSVHIEEAGTEDDN